MKKNSIGFSFLIFCFSVIFVFPGFSESNVELKYYGGGNYTLIERTDLRRYDNGQYVGLVNREVRSFINRVSAPNGISTKARFYEGNFYVMEQTVRSSAFVGSGLNDSIASAFRITSNGELIMMEDHGFPSFRSFPAFASGKISLGDRWQAKAERCVDPLNKGIPTKMPIYVEYTYIGDEVCRGEAVFVLRAQWATRYNSRFSGYDWGGDMELVNATGKHNATMYISKASGNAIIVRDAVDEVFEYADGNKYAFKGTISLFTEYPPAVDRSSIIPALQRVAGLSDEQVKNLKKPNVHETIAKAETAEKLSDNFENLETAGKDGEIADKGDNFSDAKIAVLQGENKNLTVENTEAGIRLTMQNLNFKPDSAELLPEEAGRLDEICALLKQIPQSQFLIEGHTASTGREKGEMELSRQRAFSIANEFVKRGINAGRFICKGSGGKKPVSDNSTSEGKAKNRRVEITILE